MATRCSQDSAVERDGVWVPDGDPMEAALYALARRCGIDVDADVRTSPLVREFPFDPRRRMMSVVAGGQLMVKGAPESVLSRCLPSAGAAEAADALAHGGLRVIAVASRPIHDLPVEATPTDVEVGLTLLGFAGIQDPPRASIKEALTACRAAGIRVAMLTGDNPDTAAAIAREVGLIGDAGIVLTGSDLPEDVAVLGALIDRDDGVVVSRVTPEERSRKLPERCRVVAT